jgi:hypothetical protein
LPPDEKEDEQPDIEEYIVRLSGDLTAQEQNEGDGPREMARLGKEAF